MATHANHVSLLPLLLGLVNSSKYVLSSCPWGRMGELCFPTHFEHNPCYFQIKVWIICVWFTIFLLADLEIIKTWDSFIMKLIKKKTTLISRAPHFHKPISRPYIQFCLCSLSLNFLKKNKTQTVWGSDPTNPRPPLEVYDLVAASVFLAEALKWDHLADKGWASMGKK